MLNLAYFVGRQDGGQDEKWVGRLVLLLFFGRQYGGQDEKILNLAYFVGRQDGGQGENMCNWLILLVGRMVGRTKTCLIGLFC